MKNKGRLALTIVIATLFLLIIIGTATFIANGFYRKQLPENLNAPTVSNAISEQISDARKMAYYITTANNLGKLGMAYHSCGDYISAAKCYQLAAKKNSHQWQWNYYAGYLNLEQGQSKEAIKNFEQVIEEDPANGFAAYYAGEAFEKTGFTDSAKAMFSKVINADMQDEKITDRETFFPLKTYALFQLGRLYINLSQPDSAEIVLTEIIKDEVSFGPAYRLLGNVYSMKGNDTAAKKYSLLANDLRDFSPPADNTLDKISLLSRSDKYLLKQIEDATRSSNYRWALTLCNQGMKYFPDNKTLISNVFFENFRQGNDEKALSYLDKHFNYYQNDAKELMDATDLLYSKQHLTEAIRYFNQVKKLLPKNSDLALWLYDRGKKNEAVVMMNDLIKQNPADEKIVADEVRLSLKMDDDILAGEYFTMLKKLSPASAETFKIAGLMAQKKHDTIQVLTAWEAAYKLDPKDLPFTQTLIDFYIQQKNWQQAIAHFRSSLIVYPNEPVLLEGLGRLLIACPETTLKNIPEGIEYTQRAFINFRSTYETRLSSGKTLVAAYLSLGDKKNAVKYINKTIETAKQQNKTDEYVAYFNKLTGRK